MLYLIIKVESMNLMKGGEKMAKRVIVARLTADDKEYIGKREVNIYDGNDEKTADANVGLTLRIQREIREALKAKYGLKKATTGGKAVDYSDIEVV